MHKELDLGTIQAISAETGEITWKHEQRAAATALVATGGGLIFGGDVAGRFRAFDDETGEILWETDLGAPVSGYPISFAVDGKQYVAVSVGGALLTTSLALMTPEVRASGTENRLHVFALRD